MKTSPQRSQNITPERAKHLERNRIAANKCRERKKREHKQIERRLSDEAEKKDLLIAQLNCLREEVWDLKNIIFQHSKCDDQRINAQLAKMTQSILNGPIDSPSSPDTSSPVSTGTWSDESVAEDNGLVATGAYGSDWTVLPKAANDLVYEPNGLTDSLFENFIDADSLYP
ncbi:uncharacterized protein N7515_001667 [Penicillium bovifimosum]|uniref:BZIP domain-containing protein n=1 Tax=Penicillium bovifimosum TaxID=126998 RepID=A0A9W9HA65_9EURO|nr:uncharacterized protein N7515_001667 [Penicillium bovifimosum]KAJ5142880.1 hypothetical protein N7515_001667 [Penicillium bovifimosum]